MTKLTVTDFACIQRAELAVSQFTVLIGPQASGKSVLAKLLYFFNEITTLQLDNAQSEQPFDRVLAGIEGDFRKQFPESAWGPGRFRIDFKSGPYEITVMRDNRAKTHLRVECNTAFEAGYQTLIDDYRHLRSSLPQADEATLQRLTFEQYWPLQHQQQERLQRQMGEDYVWYQLFVPAGRSFFTTLGKTAIALGNSVVSDSLTQRFGRLVTMLRDESVYGRANHMSDVAKHLLGGDVVKEGEAEVLLSPDGRKIPLNLMSSGQQEFYPLAVTLTYAQAISSSGLWVYIEEPEAHLFPSAQSRLMDLLVDTAKLENRSTRMFITTHSPYALSKINNLLKAGQLATKRPDLIASIQEIVPRNRWLTPALLSAYAIDQGVLVPLIDEDGLIDASYLDAVSSDLAYEFGGFLDLEYANG